MLYNSIKHKNGFYQLVFYFTVISLEVALVVSLDILGGYSQK